MKILFICGSLEDGRDGVGDYTLRLAGELIRQGHNATIIALHDRYNERLFDGTMKSSGISLPVLRIPADWPSVKRNSCTKKHILNFNPLWISLQFVPFSFHSKGMPIWLSSNLKKLIHGYNFHIMFHELWVGIHGEKSLKIRVLGALQKILIKKLISNNNPACITTTIPIFKKNLSDPRVSILPLFSNIPVNSKKILTNSRSTSLKAIHFGSFSGSIKEFELQLNFLNNAAIHFNKRLEFISLGDGGPFSVKSLSIAKKILGEERVIVLGRLCAPEISSTMQNGDVGISRANYTMSGKSGSTQALIEHGLPVLLRGNKADVENDNIPELITKGQLLFCDSDFSEITKKWPVKNGLREIAGKFMGFLNKDEMSTL